MELSERLAKALGWRFGGAETSEQVWWLPEGGWQLRPPAIDFTIIETILAAIEAKGWRWTHDIDGYVGIYANDGDYLGCGRDHDFYAALAEALCAAVEGEQ